MLIQIVVLACWLIVIACMAYIVLTIHANERDRRRGN